MTAGRAHTRRSRRTWSAALLVRAGAVLASTCALSTAGCDPTLHDALPAAAAHGERVHIATDLDTAVCDGTLARLDEHVRNTERTLGVSTADTQLTVYLLSDPALVERACGTTRGACFRHSVRAIFILPDMWTAALEHELVHAVAWNSAIGTTDRALSEGLATRFGDGRCGPGGTRDPRPLLGLNRLDPLPSHDYAFAGEFVGFLFDHYPVQQVLAVYRDLTLGDTIDTVERVFATHLGGLDSVAEAFMRRPAPTDHSPSLCRDPALAWDDAARTRLSWTSPLQCASPGATNVPELDPAGVEVSRRFTLPQSANVQITLDRDSDAPVLARISSCACTGGQFGVILEAPTSQSIPLRAGDYRVELIDPTGSGATATFSVALP